MSAVERSFRRSLLVALVIGLAPLVLSEIAMKATGMTVWYDLSEHPTTTYQGKWMKPSPPEIMLDIQLELSKVDTSTQSCKVRYVISAANITQIRQTVVVSGMFYSPWLTRTNQTTRYEAMGQESNYVVWSHDSSPITDVELPMHSSHPEMAPFDYYECPRVLIAIDGNVFLRSIALSSFVPPGYVAFIRDPDPRTYNSETDKKWLAGTQNGIRLIAKREYQNEYLLDILVTRSRSQVNLQYWYLTAVSYFVYLSAVIVVSRINRLEDRLKVFVGVTLSVFAFIWGFRQNLPAVITYWELTIIFGILVWAILEYVRAMGWESSSLG